MSNLVIAEVSEFRRHTLWLGIKEDPVTSQLVTSEQNIVLTNPAQVALPQGVVRQMSLWLYHVAPNEHLRNSPFVRRKDPAFRWVPSTTGTSWRIRTSRNRPQTTTRPP